MTEIGIIVLSDVVTLAISLCAVVFASGKQWGEIKADVRDLKTTVAKIEGMFVVKLRDDHIDRS